MKSIHLLTRAHRLLPLTGVFLLTLLASCGGGGGGGGGGGDTSSAGRNTSPLAISAINTSPAKVRADSDTFFSGNCIGGTGDIAYRWEYGDGSQADEKAETSHKYIQPGSYTVKLTCRTSDGQVTSQNLNMNVDKAIDPSVVNRTCTSVNPGEGWCTQNPLPTASNLNSVKAVDANSVFAVGDGGVILKTTNGGTSWSPMNSGTAQNLKSIVTIDANTAWVVGGKGTILKTIDPALGSLNLSVEAWSIVHG